MALLHAGSLEVTLAPSPRISVRPEILVMLLLHSLHCVERKVH